MVSKKVVSLSEYRRRRKQRKADPPADAVGKTELQRLRERLAALQEKNKPK